jgi:para-aminobenzoate synthetase component 1
MVSFDQRQWHVEPCAAPSGKVWYALGSKRFSQPASCAELPKRLVKKPLDFKTYQAQFDQVQEAIKAGNTYLLNLTCKTPLDNTLSLEALFHASQAPFRCLLKETFVCFSPERFIKIQNNHVHTYPMKGTIDAALPDAKKRVLEDDKEKAEHVMVVDLLRNDLSMIASCVRVEKFRYVEEIAAGNKSLLQVSSHVQGALRPAWHDTLGTLLTTLLPAGSISGTPKRKTVELIQHIELYERGYFTGIFGVYDGKNLDSAVMIRFVEKTQEGFVYKSGGGITLQSEARKEYAEMLDKVYAPLL